MKKQKIRCIGFSTGQSMLIYEHYSKIELLLSGIQDDIIGLVQFDRREFVALIKKIYSELEENEK